MATPLPPEVGQWYQRLETGIEFQVIEVHDAHRVVEVQDADGESAQLDLDSWFELELQPTTPRRDWSRADDELEPDDFGYGEEDQPAAGGPSPDGIEPRSFDED